MKRIIKSLIGSIARFYHKIRSNRIVWKILNNKSSKLFLQNKIKLNNEEEKVLNDLKRDGIAITHIDKIFPNNIFKELENWSKNRWNDNDVKERYENRHNAIKGDKLLSKSFFLIDLWKGERILDLSNIFTKFSLSNPILNIVNSYMNMNTKFTDWRLQVTVPMPEGMRSYASQEWHRDPEDQQLIKVFLYLNDVDENSGPFIYLKKSHFGGKWRHLFPQKPPRGSAGEESKIPQEDKLICTCKAGSLIFCDTSGLHRGGHAKSNNRFMYTGVYVSSASVWPVMYKASNNLDSSNLSDSTKYAIINKVKDEPKYYGW